MISGTPVRGLDVTIVGGQRDFLFPSIFERRTWYILVVPVRRRWKAE